ncbi:hypothetical protein Q4575_09995 [Psychrosphaera sp. 1_MG-2023]|uniref:TolB family protein n=1 Tax=Psychrosphaera sp. 1_MG-2023 TaxID=3062643 RepID=UPI0026E264B1|nr:hypothetical protein [Psychrosphaera sp. 1_MG-2023]MDO6719734.1 hypothetical protein [Psychrosphaera sp. 1_MG-2023]
MFKNRIILLINFLLLMFIVASGQGIADPMSKLDWKIFKTEHFRIHYTAEYEEWSIAAAHEMEASRTVLLQQQKRSLPEVVNVVVFDPLNDSNGFAIPYSNKPFMALFATAPQSDSQISNSSSWPQLLSLHEYAHLLHLAQPSRNTWTNFVASIYDIYDVTNGITERWVAEGYATLLESKLTGRGRLYDVQVEMMLQQFAREGGWPTYNELSSTSGRYRIGNMAYLVGGRFLAWIEANYSEKKLDAVWTRMKGAKKRNFEKAFVGVFNQPAQLLYQRFVAEFTQKVMNLENKDIMDKYSLWLDGDFELAEPTLSPNSELLAVVEKSKGPNAKVNLVVYETKENIKAKEKFEKAQKDLIEADPIDIADTPPVIFKRKKKFNLAQRNFNGIRHPRWMGDDALLFVSSTTDSNNFKHQDLFKWKLSTGNVTQLTDGLNVRRFDVDIASGRVYAELNKFGYSSLVQFNITNLSGTVQANEIETASLQYGYDFPRVNPTNNSQLAYLEHNINQPWRIKIRNLTTQETSYVALPHEYQFLSFLNWSRDGKALYYVAGKGEALKMYRYEFEDQKLFALTQGHVPVAWPMELPNKLGTTILFSSYRSTGPNLYSFQTSKGNWHRVFGISDQQNWEYLESISPYPIKMPAASFNQDDSIGEHLDYNSSEGLWRQDKTLTVGGQFNSASTNLLEIGVKGSDLLQILNWQLNASLDSLSNTAAGVSGYLNFRKYPINLTADFHYFNLDFNEQGHSVRGDKTTFAGVGFSADYPYRLFETYSGEFNASYDHNEYEPDGYAVVSDKSMSFGHKQQFWFDRQSWGVVQSSSINWLSGETERDLVAGVDDWTGTDLQLSLGAHYQGILFTTDYLSAERKDSSYDLLSIGGMPSTLIAEDMFSHWQFAPELPFGYDTGDKFERITFALSSRTGGSQFYYSELVVDSYVIMEIVGLRSKEKINMYGTGLSDLVFDYGLATLISPEDEYSVQGWFGLRYQY